MNHRIPSIWLCNFQQHSIHNAWWLIIKSSFEFVLSLLNCIKHNIIMWYHTVEHIANLCMPYLTVYNRKVNLWIIFKFYNEVLEMCLLLRDYFSGDLQFWFSPQVQICSGYFYSYIKNEKLYFNWFDSV